MPVRICAAIIAAIAIVIANLGVASAVGAVARDAVDPPAGVASTRVVAPSVPTTPVSSDFPAGSLIVDMGVSTQTVANGLKPYGFVYELLKTYKIPVAWIIRSGKTSANALKVPPASPEDFTATNVVDLSTNATVSSKTFSGGSFVISAPFAAEIPSARITYWKGLGVKLYRTTSALTGLPQYSLLRSWPKIVLDDASGAVADSYYSNAGIPTSAYRYALPSGLTSCDDLFVFPHSDPTWANAGQYLLPFNQNGGFIFSQCHGVSVLENLDSPDAGTAPDSNFLTVTGLVPDASHTDGTPPYTYTADGSDPVLQVMSKIDTATTNGSEQIYLPRLDGGWRTTTHVLAWDPDHPQLVGGSGTDLSAGPAAISAYGRGFGVATNGMVMYQAGHDFAKATQPDNISAQRTFLNFNLLAGIDRSPVVEATIPTATVAPGSVTDVSATTSGGSGPYSYKWTSSCGGTFGNDTAASTTFTAPWVAEPLACTLRVTVTDHCGRVAFDADSVPIEPQPFINVSKTPGTTSGPTADGDYAVTYTVRVENSSSTAGSYGPISDTPRFAPNLVPTGLSWVRPGVSSGSSGGPFEIGLANTPIAGGATHVYDVTITFHYADATQAVLCSGPNTGLYNSVALPAGQEQGALTDNNACVPPPPPPAPAITVLKTVSDASGDGIATVGEVLTYGFTVTNTGDVSLSNVIIADPFLGINVPIACGTGTLAPSASRTCAAVTHTVTDSDTVGSVVSNTVTASGTPPTGPRVTATSTATIPAASTVPSISLDKSVSDATGDGIASIDEVLTYTFTVTNNGTSDLTGVTVTDPMFAPSTFGCGTGSLAIGDSCTVTRTYTVQAADIANGTVHNTATASGTPPTGPPVTDTDTTTVPAPAVPDIELAKSVADSPTDADALASLGETLTYTFTVKNVGNVVLNDVTITDPRLGLTGPSALACGSGPLAVGAERQCTATYTVVADDLAADAVVNYAKATGTPPSGPPVTDQDCAGISTSSHPGIQLTKTVNDSGDADSIASLGETITYHFSVKNTGDVPLQGIRITDAMYFPSGADCLVGTLSPGDSTTCPALGTLTHVVTADDITAGHVVNTATATGLLTPTGPSVSDDDSATIATDSNAPAITLAKTVADSADDGSLASVGEVLTYTFTVTNTGNATLNPVKISDPLLGGTPFTCGAGSLAPGQTCTTTRTHTVVDADIVGGEVRNTATATGKPPTGPDVTATASAALEAEDSGPLLAGLSIDKSVDSAQALPGNQLDYELRVRNTGPGDAEDVVVTDTLPAGTSFVSATDPCTHSGPTVTCALGTVAANTVRTLVITVEVAELSGGDTSHQHQLDFTKIETHLSLQGGQTGTATAICPAGYIATDGSVRLDAVDQGTGTFADAEVLASHATGDGTGWFGKVHNDAAGQVQAKVNVVCASDRTTSGEDHSHGLVVTDFQSESGALTAGQAWTADLTCAAGSMPISPGFAFDSGAGRVSTRHTDSGWHFRVDPTTDGSVTASTRCLSMSVASTDGHTHDLAFTEVTGAVSVGAGEVAERSLTCPVGYKGAVAWADMDPGLVSMGNDPQPITRVFRFYNPTDGPLDADYGLVCMAIRSGGGTAFGDRITNTASVRTSSPDATTSDDTDSVTFTVSPVVSAPTGHVVAQAGATKVKVSVTSLGKRSVKMKLLAVGHVRGTSIGTGDLLATGATTLRSGRHAVVLKAVDRAAKPLRTGKVGKAKLVITARDGTRTTRIITIAR